MRLFILNFLIIILLLIFLIYKKNIDDFKSEKKELFFIHIPKNAGTTIENTVEKYNILWGKKYFKNKDVKLKSNILKKNSLWHIPPKYFLDNSYKNKILFSVVRNPYERIISECKWISKSKNKKCNNINDFIMKKLEEYKKNKFSSDNHLIPQSEFIYGNPQCNEILRFENLNEDFEKLMKKYNYPKIKLLHHNKSEDRNITIRNLNKKSIDLINEVYKEDFKNFGYDKIKI